MVKNGQKMGFLGPKMTLFVVQSGSKQPKNPSKVYKTSTNIFFGLIETLSDHFFAIKRN
jgi:hypothetical protein